MAPLLILPGKRFRVLSLALTIGAGQFPAVAAVRGPAAPATRAGTQRRARASTTAHPRCFGAAARDPDHQPCANPELRLTVLPRPRDAPLEPSGPCRPIRNDAPEVCAFGVPAPKARATIALIGDSHAVHWRAALDVVARAERWRGLSISRSACEFTRATRIRPAPGPAECRRWTQEVVRWLAHRPRVRTVFVSESAAMPVKRQPGEDEFATKVAGYRTAWRALRRSVAHVVVIRDTPVDAVRTADCVEHAMARRIPAGPACARPRRSALYPDPAAAAVSQLASPRFALVDLTDFMCDAALCYPVVGGVLVHRDVDHLTRLFSSTLGPFLLRAVDRLMTSWPAKGPG
jgi:SGNH domain-containing protein